MHNPVYEETYQGHTIKIYQALSEGLFVEPR